MNDGRELVRRLRMQLGGVAGADFAISDARAPGGVTGNACNLRRAAQRANVLFENLVGGRHAGSRCGEDVGRLQHRLAVNPVHRWRCRGTRLTAMAGPARHHVAAVEAGAVDGVHHLDHRAGGPLARRIVFPLRIGSAGAGVTVAAAQAERGGDESHRPEELVDGNAFQDLNVLERLIRQLRLLAWFIVIGCASQARVHRSRRGRRRPRGVHALRIAGGQRDADQPHQRHASSRRAH